MDANWSNGLAEESTAMRLKECFPRKRFRYHSRKKSEDEIKRGRGLPYPLTVCPNNKNGQAGEKGCFRSLSLDSLFFLRSDQEEIGGAGKSQQVSF